MKKVIKIGLAVLLVCLFVGCATNKTVDPIVGLWNYESGSTWYLIMENGDAFQINTNGTGQYITNVDVYKPGSYDIRSDGGYTSNYSWYKEDGEYYWKTTFGEPVETVHVNGDTLVFGDDVYEWYRVPDSKLIPLDEIYYFTVDLENMAYVEHPLSELVENN